MPMLGIPFFTVEKAGMMIVFEPLMEPIEFGATAINNILYSKDCNNGIVLGNLRFRNFRNG